MVARSSVRTGAEVLTSRIQHAVTAAQNLIAAGNGAHPNEISMVPHARVLLKVSSTVLSISIIAPKPDRHAEKRFGDDKVPLFAGVVNVTALAVVNLDLHTNTRRRNLTSVDIDYRVAGYD